MAAIGFPEHAKTVTLPSGTTYSWVYIPKKDVSKTTILFLHGFPSSSYDWLFQIPYFTSKGYGVLAPDLLGYGGSDKPDSPEGYVFKKQAADIIAILHHEGLDKIHAVGHDFGSIFLSVLLGYYPEIMLSTSFLAVPYTPTATVLNLEYNALKEFTESKLGFEKYGYQRWFIEDDSWKLIDEHADSFFTVGYGSMDNLIENFFPSGKLEAWLKADRKAPYPSWMTTEYKEKRDRIMASGYRGPTNWYRCRMGLKLGCKEEVEEIDARIPCRALFIGSAESAASMPGTLESTGQFADKYQGKLVSTTGHWVQLEAADEVNKMLEAFFEEE